MVINRYVLEILFFLDTAEEPVSLLTMDSRLSGYAHRYSLIRKLVAEGWIEPHKVRGESQRYSITGKGRNGLRLTSEWRLREGGTVAGGRQVTWLTTTYVPQRTQPARAGASDAFLIPSRGV